MIDLKKEAKEYLKYLDDKTGTTWTEDDSSIVEAFEDFAKTSKYVQSERIKAQLECLNKSKDLDIQTVYRDLQKQLEDLCNQ
jgi:phosphopantetheine adenylyltransferase